MHVSATPKIILIGTPRPPTAKYEFIFENFNCKWIVSLLLLPLLLFAIFFLCVPLSHSCANDYVRFFSFSAFFLFNAVVYEGREGTKGDKTWEEEEENLKKREKQQARVSIWRYIICDSKMLKIRCMASRPPRFSSSKVTFDTVDYVPHMKYK